MVNSNFVSIRSKDNHYFWINMDLVKSIKINSNSIVIDGHLFDYDTIHERNMILSKLGVNLEDLEDL